MKIEKRSGNEIPNFDILTKSGDEIIEPINPQL